MQALKFESSASDAGSDRQALASYDDSGLADLLLTRAVKNRVLGNRLYWYLTVEVSLEDPLMAKMYGRILFKFLQHLQKVQVLLRNLAH